MEKVNRHNARRMAFQVFFLIDASGEPAQRALEKFWNGLAELRDMQSFSDELVLGWWEHRERIDDLITKHSTNWRLERMARADRCVLRLASYELLRSELPKSIVINEAIELVKEFSERDSSSFVNGILDSVAKELGRD